MKHFILSIAITLIASVSFCQSNNYRPKKIAAADLKNDLLFLQDTLQKIHPGLYRYKSKSAINNLFDSARILIGDSMPAVKFYILTSRVIAGIEDGHTNCRLAKEDMENYTSNVKVFPAQVLLIHNGAFIYCCQQNQDLNGTQLLAIDGISMDKIIPHLFEYISSDGNIQSRKNWELSGIFNFLYNDLYGEKNSYKVAYRSKGGLVKSTTLSADFSKNIFCDNPFKRPSKYLQLSYDSNNVAVLTIKTFFDGFLHQTNENFKTFLDSSFQEIKKRKVQKLLIDVRGNQGGNDNNGELLYSYLAQTPFRYYASQASVSEEYTETNHPNLGLKQPNNNAYTGKVYFLADGRSFSATAEFCAIARSNERGVFIGEETGGGYYGNTSGDDITIILPNSRIECRIPLVKYTMAVKNTLYRIILVIQQSAI
jgi:hypothetical protein